MIKIGPSLLAADFTNLGHELKRIQHGGADYLHLDIMDGHFVPNISYGPDVVRQLRKETELFFDVHLMIEDPDRYLLTFKEAGADMITVHQETCPHLHRTIQAIKEMGLKAGVALNPATPVEVLSEILPALDLVLVMSVNPGFGGQGFIPDAVPKIERLSRMIHEKGLSTIIQVDGGINSHTAKLVVDAGASWLVAGSAVFGQDDVEKAIRDIRLAGSKTGD